VLTETLALALAAAISCAVGAPDFAVVAAVLPVEAGEAEVVWLAPVAGAAGLEAAAFPPFEPACPLALTGEMLKAINKHEAKHPPIRIPWGEPHIFPTLERSERPNSVAGLMHGSFASPPDDNS
jgi:hypothetical protein